MTTEITEQVKLYVRERHEKKRDDLAKKHEKQLKQTVSPEEKASLLHDHAQERDDLAGQFDTANWLDDAAKRAYQTNLATHVLKFTHSSAKGSNALTLDYDADPLYVDSGCLKTPQIDATGNAAALDVAKLLKITTQGKTLAQHYIEKNDAVLAPLAQSDGQWRAWANGFRKALEDNNPSSHTLAKQVYFPVGDGEYHVLSPLYASSLAQEIYDRIQENRYGDAQKQARKAKKEKKLYDMPCVSYPNLAVCVAGGTKPQNVSQLNSGRSGRTFLLPCTPPTWKAQGTPPLFVKSFFSIPRVNKAVTQNIIAFSDFLKEIAHKPATHLMQEQRMTRVSDIIDILLDIAVSVRGYPLGWSAESRLTRSYQLWLDPARKEPDFQTEYRDKTWQDTVARDFGLWLVQSLAKKTGDKTVLHQELSHMYAKQFKQALRDMERFL